MAFMDLKKASFPAEMISPEAGDFFLIVHVSTREKIYLQFLIPTELGFCGEERLRVVKGALHSLNPDRHNSRNGHTKQLNVAI